MEHTSDGVMTMQMHSPKPAIRLDGYTSAASNLGRLPPMCENGDKRFAGLSIVGQGHGGL